MKVETEIKPKWKAFAMNQTLSGFEGIPEEVFDELMGTTDENMQKAFEANEIIIWEPFENRAPEEVAQLIHDLARHAQAVEAEAELKPFYVLLFGNQAAILPSLFHCLARDSDDAFNLARKAYPGGVLLLAKEEETK